MVSGWERFKRNGGRIGGGLVVFGSALYAAKKLYNYWQSTNGNSAESGGQSSRNDEEMYRQYRQYVFDSHQESCDKMLSDVINRLRLQIAKQFDCDELVERLRSAESLSPAEKIEIWKQLEFRSVARLLAMAHSYALTVVSFKLQKALLCREMVPVSRSSAIVPGASILGYLSSWIGPTADQSPEEKADPMVQQLFANCINYFVQEGVVNFCAEIGEAARERLATVALTDNLSPVDLRRLLGEICDGADMFGCVHKHYYRHVVPDSRPVLASLCGRSERLRLLLESLIGELESRWCRELLADLTQLHLDYVNKFIDTALSPPTGGLPMAKLIPVLVDVFAKATAIDERSAFAESLRSHELYRRLYRLFNEH